jgi:glycosyltransferase involved in cell wall biosynthesis
MNIILSAHRPFHFVQLANALSQGSDRVDLYSSAPRRFFSGLHRSVRLHFTPSPILLASHACPRLVTESMLDLDTLLYDMTVAAILPHADLFLGLATRSLRSAKRAKQRGSRFVLDRACPHVRVQQALLQREADRVGFAFRPQPPWFVERQIEEYELADAILVPSRYTAGSFPDRLQSRLVLAPLLGRTAIPDAVTPTSRSVFTLGVVGNSPLRKGYLYLLRAWKRIALPNAQLLIRCGASFEPYPALRQLLRELPNVQMVPYISDMSIFFRRCDAFVMPSVDDGFGMAIFEALAHGIPTIATHACGASELLVDGTDSLIVQAENEDSLAEAILTLYESQDLRRSIGLEGAATARRVAASRVYEGAIHDMVMRLTSGSEMVSRPDQRITRSRSIS